MATHAFENNLNRFMDALERFLDPGFPAKRQKSFGRMVYVLQLATDTEDNHRVRQTVDRRLHTEVRLKEFPQRAFAVFR